VTGICLTLAVVPAYVVIFQLEGLIDGHTECLFDPKGSWHLMSLSYPVGECMGGVLSI
jgi:hypothetical protein